MKLLAPLHNKTFAAIFFGLSISGLGSNIFVLGVLWFVMAATKSAGDVALVRALQSLSTVIFFAPAMVLGDRINRRTLALVTEFARFTVSICLAAFLWRSNIKLWAIAMSVTLLEGGGLFYGPSLNSMLPKVLDLEELTSANSLIGGMVDATQIIGRAIGGFLVNVAGVTILSVLNGITYLFSWFGVWAIPRDIGNISRLSLERPRVVAVVREIFLDRRLRTVALSFSLTNLGMGSMLVLPVVLVFQRLHGGAGTLGIVESAMAVGGVLGPFLLPYLSPRYAPALGALIMTVGALGTAASTSVAVALTFFVASGVGLQLFVVPQLSGLQASISDEIRSRVFILLEVFASGATQPMSAWLMGVLSTTMGVQWAYVVGAGLFLSAGAVAVGHSNSPSAMEA